MANGIAYSGVVQNVSKLTSSIFRQKLIASNQSINYNTIQNTSFYQSTKHGIMRNDKYKYDNRGKHVCVVTILFQIMIILSDQPREDLLLSAPVRSDTSQSCFVTDVCVWIHKLQIIYNRDNTKTLFSLHSGVADLRLWSLEYAKSRHSHDSAYII